MKKRILLLLLAFVMVFAFTACGGSKAAGEFTCTKVSMEVEGEEVSLDPAEAFEGGVTLVLNSDGTASLTLGEDSTEATWEASGSDFTLTIEGSESKGTISETTIELDLMGMGMKYIFEKNNSSEE